MGKSRLTNPARISRLMIAVSLAYIWIIYLGDKKGWGKIHTSNCYKLNVIKTLQKPL